jgi:hypothetical protein
VPLEDIARLVGHSGTAITEAVYRKQIRPVIEQGATAMNRIFPRRKAGAVVTHLVSQNEQPFTL